MWEKTRVKTILIKKENTIGEKTGGGGTSKGFCVSEKIKKMVKALKVLLRIMYAKVSANVQKLFISSTSCFVLEKKKDYYKNQLFFAVL